MISIVIPVFNEEETIVNTLEWIKERSGAKVGEIIVVDGGSTDQTVNLCRKKGVNVIQVQGKGRAIQMNAGAQQAKGEILYFLHADSIPPPGFDEQIVRTLSDEIMAGCFRLEFDDSHPVLRAYAWFTRFDINLFRFGDQSLFVKKAVFNSVGGYKENHLVMEDQEIVIRLKKRTGFKVMNESVVTSARKYQRVGIFKLQLIFVFIVLLYYAGLEQKALVLFYQKMMEQG